MDFDKDGVDIKEGFLVEEVLMFLVAGKTAWKHLEVCDIMD